MFAGARLSGYQVGVVRVISSNGDRTVSILAVFNDGSYETQLTAFNSSVEFDKPVAAVTPPTAAPQLLNGKLVIPMPTRQLTIADIVGEWGETSEDVEDRLHVLRVLVPDQHGRPAYGLSGRLDLVGADARRSDLADDADELDRFPKGAGFPGNKADWGWVPHILASLKPHGRAAVVLDTGAALQDSTLGLFTSPATISSPATGTAKRRAGERKGAVLCARCQRR